MSFQTSILSVVEDGVTWISWSCDYTMDDRIITLLMSC